MENIGVKIKEARKLKGYTQKELAEIIDCYAPEISDWENGKIGPGKHYIKKLSKALGISVEDLFSAEGEAFPSISNQDDTHDFVYIPQVSGRISAGGGLEPENTIELKVAFRKEWIERRGNPKNMSMIRVQGDSMEPTLYSGDMVLIDHARNHLTGEGGIYAIALNHEIMIKRLQLVRSEGKIKVISDNEKYQPEFFDPREVVINGKLIWFAREIER